MKVSTLSRPVFRTYDCELKSFGKVLCLLLIGKSFMVVAAMRVPF